MWKVWGKGLLAAVINGLAGGILLVASDAAGLDDPAKLAKSIAVVTLVSVANYLKRSPLPDGPPPERQ